ncbi:MAG: endonuclease/exonuclease/phosphatase family protein [Verrucomicrobia bacterium]|nr:endonuclease/exonuclease/phosphatase family protein [Verrucomicrobiota bacterium]
MLAKSSQKLRVVTYNILFDLFDNQLEEKTHSWPERLPRVIKSIEMMKPDILCVQEPYPTQLKDLQKQLENTFACFVGTSTTGELNAIFYNKERFKLDSEPYSDGAVNLSSASLSLPLNPKDEALVKQIPNFLPPELEPCKQLTMVHLRDKRTNKSFAVLNTHLTYYRVNSREDQAHFIVGLIRKLYALKKPVIFTGDLNTFPNRPDIARFRYYDGNHIKQIFETVLKNTQDVALLGHVGPLSTFTKDFLNPDSKPFEGTGTVGVILDYIYVSPEITVLINATEPSKVNGQFPSDHMPVIADILLPYCRDINLVY